MKNALARVIWKSGLARSMWLWLPALVAAVIVGLIVVSAGAAAAPPQDKLVKLFGAPTKLHGGSYYERVRGGVVFDCRIWLFGAGSSVSAYVEQCVALGKAKPKKKAKVKAGSTS